MTHLKTFFVTTTIKACGFERPSTALITAPNEKVAQDYALLLESPDPSLLKWSGNKASDMDGRCVYEHCDCREVSQDEALILRERMTHFTAQTDNQKAFIESLNK